MRHLTEICHKWAENEENLTILAIPSPQIAICWIYSCWSATSIPSLYPSLVMGEPSDFQFSEFSQHIRYIPESSPSLPSSSPSLPSSSTFSSSSTSSSSVLYSFTPTNSEEILAIIKKNGIKTSPSDPLPSFLLKRNLSATLPHLVNLVNLSLSTCNLTRMYA